MIDDDLLTFGPEVMASRAAKGEPMPDLWAYMGAGAHLEGSAALGAALEAQINTTGGSFCVLLLCQADLVTAPDTTLRSVWGAVTAANGTVVFAGRDFTDGSRYRSSGADGLGTGVYTHSGGGPELIDGDLHQLAHTDVGTGANGLFRAQVDDGADLSPSTSYTRADLGTVDRISFGGEDRSGGVIPWLGWTYAAAVLDEDIRGSLDSIWQTFDGVHNGRADNLAQACRAWIQAIEDAATAPSNVLFSQIFRRGSGATHGDDVNPVGVQWTPAGVQP